jgi:hypothetical protein
MNLRDNQITIGELMTNSSAKALLKKEFTEVANPLMLSMARKMTLESVLNLAKGRYPQEKIQRVLSELQAMP